MEVRIHTDKFNGYTGIAFFEEKNGRLYMAKKIDLVFEEINPSDTIDEPTLKLDRHIANEFLQELSNALNQAGFISENVNGYKLELGATKYHLEDMRKLIFSNKGIEI